MATNNPTIRRKPGYAIFLESWHPASAAISPTRSEHVATVLGDADTANAIAKAVLRQQIATDIRHFRVLVRDIADAGKLIFENIYVIGIHAAKNPPPHGVNPFDRPHRDTADAVPVCVPVYTILLQSWHPAEADMPPEISDPVASVIGNKAMAIAIATAQSIIATQRPTEQGHHRVQVREVSPSGAMICESTRTELPPVAKDKAGRPASDPFFVPHSHIEDTDGKKFGQDELRRVTEFLAILNGITDPEQSAAVTAIRGLLPDFEKLL